MLAHLGACDGVARTGLRDGGREERGVRFGADGVLRLSRGGTRCGCAVIEPGVDAGRVSACTALAPEREADQAAEQRETADNAADERAEVARVIRRTQSYGIW